MSHTYHYNTASESAQPEAAKESVKAQYTAVVTLRDHLLSHAPALILAMSDERAGAHAQAAAGTATTVSNQIESNR